MNESDIARLRRSALIWASEYHNEATAEWYADWYATERPNLSHVAAFAEFDLWRGRLARKLSS